jgi:hypothetical protein
MLKFAISSSRSKIEEKKSFLGILTLGSCPRLLREHVQKVSKKLTASIVRLKCLNWKEKFFYPVPGRDNKL